MVEVADPTLTLGTRGPLFDAHAALETRLKLAFPERKFVHQVVPAQLSESVFGAMVKRCPAIALGFAGLTPARSPGRVYSCEAKWMVFAATRNARPEGLLLGDKAGGVGQLGLVGLGVALLHGWTARGLGTWRVGEVRNAYAESWVHDDVALAAIEVSIDLEIVDEAAAAALPEFLRLGGHWNLPDLADEAAYDTLDTVRAA